MRQLGVFLIPSPTHPFYRVGAGILGYDIWQRRQAPSTLAGDVEPEMLRRWLEHAPEFGVHCTVSGTALNFNDADVPEIEARLGWIASRTAPFTLVNGRVDATYRGYPKSLAAIFDSPDGALQRVHRQVVTLISPLHVRSNYAPWLSRLADRPRELYMRTGEPWVLELYAPHWSLMTGLPDAAAWEHARDLITRRAGLLADDSARAIEIEVLHLVQRGDDGRCSVIGSYPLTGCS